MKETPLQIPFPLKGLVVNQALDQQPPLTTPSALNVRGYDPKAGRDRGGQRSGLSRYCPQQVMGAALIQCIHTAVYTGSQTAQTVSPLTDVGYNPWNYLDTGLIIYDHRLGTSVTYDGSLTGSGHGPACLGSCWDQSGNVYGVLFTWNGGTAGGFKTGNIYVVAIRAATPTVAAAQLWLSLTLGSTLQEVVGVAYGDGFIWVAATDNGIANIRLWKIDATTGAIVGGTYVYTEANGNTGIIKAGSEQISNWMAYANGKICLGYNNGKVSVVNTATYTATSYTIPSFGNGDIFGHVGYITGISTDGSAFYVAGASLPFNPPTNLSHLVKLDLSGVQQWLVEPSENNCTGVCYDAANNVIALAFWTNAVQSIKQYDPGTGAFLQNLATQSQLPSVWSILPDGNGGYLTHGIATPDLYDITNTVPIVTNWNNTESHHGIGVTISANPFATVFSSQPAGNTILSPRTVRALAVSQGTVKRFTRSGVVPIAGGAGALSPTGPIFADQLGQAVYFVDGLTYKYYDCATDRVLPLVPTQGSLPVDAAGNACRLQTVWRNRLVVSGLRLDPYNWFMSGVFDATNWNYNPVPAVETEATAGNNITAGQNPDIVNALVPYSDEILLFGGDHTIYQMTGDPQSGGRIDLVTDQVGMAFGRPWCRDGQGVVYFFSNRGSVYKFVPGSQVERMSDPIAELLLDVDLSKTIARMAWDERSASFYLWLSPTDTPRATFNYVWDTRNGAWWQDQYAFQNHNPVAVCVMDGDLPIDRVLLIGSWDGYIRQVDPAALDDDLYPINSYVFLGPLRDKLASGTLMADLQCQLDSTSGQAVWSVYAGNSAQDALANPARQAGLFSAGRNRSQSVRAFGHALYVRLASTNTLGSAWQLERLVGRLRMAEGRARERIF